MTNETKTYAITEKLRNEFIDIMRNNPQDPEAYDAITELESLPLITGEPVAYARKWHVDKVTPTKEKNENGRMAWPRKFKFLPVTSAKVFNDDAPLYTQPQPPPVTEPKGLFIDLMNEHFPNGIEAERPLQSITADDITKDMLQSLDGYDFINYAEPNALVAAAVNAFIKHKGDTK